MKTITLTTKPETPAELSCTDLLSGMSRNDKSLLLYLETCAVDYGGLVEARRMNAEDVVTMEQWNESGFVVSGRVSSADLRLWENHNRRPTQWCELSGQAWQAAHTERRARCQRLMEKRDWTKTAELRAAA